MPTDSRIVVIVSGMPASGKTTIAKALASTFNLKYYAGGDALKAVALEKGYGARKDDWWDTLEGLRFLKERMKNMDFDREVDRKLIQLIRGENVVVTSYTLPWLTEDGLRVWLKASPENRAKRMAKRDKIDYDKAFKIIRKRDEKNAKLYGILYKLQFGTDLSRFDLVISTDNLSTDSVIRIVSEATKCFFKIV